MITNKTRLWPVIGILAAMSVNADQVILDDVIVQGAACIGLDCAVNGSEPLVDGELKVKENNLRIRFIDTTVNPVLDTEQALGQKWNVEANSSANGGESYFGFQLKQEKTGNVLAEDEGRVPEYGCDVAGATANINDFLFEELLTGGFIAVGDPIEVPAFAEPPVCSGTFPDNYRCEVECVPGNFVSVRSLLTLSPNDTSEPMSNGVALGYESAGEPDVVSVGRADLARRISHVAAGMSGTDVLTVAGLNGLSQQLAGFNAELDDIEARIAILESDVFRTLLSTVQGTGPGSSFTSKVTNAQAAYVRGNIRSACNILDAFQNQVAAQTGKKISVALAAQLNAEAQDVKNDIGCT